MGPSLSDAIANMAAMVERLNYAVKLASANGDRETQAIAISAATSAREVLEKLVAVYMMVQFDEASTPHR